MSNIEEFTGEVSFRHTENPEKDVHKRDSAEVVILPSDGVVWRIHGCKHHLREFVEAEKNLGSDSSYYWFEDGVGNFCPVCWSIYHYAKFGSSFQNQTPYKKE